jgi:hypothetical protein
MIGFSAAALLVLGGCDQTQSQSASCTPEARDDDAELLRKLPKPLYFPAEWSRSGQQCANRCIETLSPFAMTWYSEHLAAAQEPSLYAASKTSKSAGETQMRFTWLRSFHHPVTVRVVSGNSSYRLIARELSGAGGYAPGTVVRTIDRMLTPQEQRKVESAFSSDLFDPPFEACAVGLDGAQWIVESVSGTEYRFADRHSPQDGPIREAGLLMLRLTGWQFANIY